MEITPELLEKYYGGSCTETEKQVIEKWLESPEADIAFPSKTKLSALEAEMWSNIDPKEKTGAIMLLHTKLVRFSAASCLLLGMAFGIISLGNSFFLTPEIVFNDAQVISLKQFHTAGVDFTLLPDSKIKVAANVFNSQLEMGFCGSIVVVSKQQHDIDLKVNATCNAPLDNRMHVSLKAGKKYVVFQHKYAFNETYVVDVNRIRQLPPVLKHKVNQLVRL